MESMNRSFKRKQIQKQTVSMDMISEQRSKESNVGRRLTDYTTRKVICIVLFMLFTNDAFMVSSYITEPQSLSYPIELICDLDKRNADKGRHIDTNLHKKIFDDTV